MKTRIFPRITFFFVYDNTNTYVRFKKSKKSNKNIHVLRKFFCKSNILIIRIVHVVRDTLWFENVSL